MVAFVTDPTLEGTNNRAERELRPHTIARHRSGGARSDEGAQTYAINLSVVRTVALHCGDFLDNFRQARIAFHEGVDFPKLFPARLAPPADSAPASLNQTLTSTRPRRAGYRAARMSNTSILWDAERRAALRRTLAEILPRETDQRRFVTEAGFRAASIGFESSADNTWFNILEHARNHDGGLDRVLAHALAADEGRDSVNLRRLREGASLKLLSAPDLSPGAWRGEGRQGRALEKVLGEQSTLVPVAYLEVGLRRARAVAKVLRPDNTAGTGFLIDGDLLVTNNHVLPDVEAARGARALFDFEQTSEGLAREVTEMAVLPEAFFKTSVDDDWTVVRVAEGASRRWGTLALCPTALKVGQRVNIIQHPGGGPKQLSYVANLVAYAGQDRLQYLTDTQPGSSGAPVFDHAWNLVAVHHSGGWIVEPGGDPARPVLRNEGILIDAVIRGLGARA